MQRSNDLINEDTMHYYIESSFHTRGYTPLKQGKRSYCETLCQDRATLLKKLSCINYGHYFAQDFKASEIDSKLEGIKTSEKAKLLKNVIDVMFHESEVSKAPMEEEVIKEVKH